MDIISKTYSPSMTKPRPHRWQDDAACAEIGSELFFPVGRGSLHLYLMAKQICDTCPVEALCLQYALDREKYPDDVQGMFGGLTPPQRRRLHGFPQRDPKHENGE